ncbi:hypothetical protein V8F06_010813 [Rhypophila decipiens]
MRKCGKCGYTWEDEYWTQSLFFCDPCVAGVQTGASPASMSPVQRPTTSGYDINPSSGRLSRQQSLNFRPSEFAFNYPSATNSQPHSQLVSRPPSSQGHRSRSDHSSSKHEEKRQGKAVDYSSDHSGHHSRHGGHSSDRLRHYPSSRDLSHKSSSSSLYDSHSLNPAVYKGKKPGVGGGDNRHRLNPYFYSGSEDEAIPAQQNPKKPQNPTYPKDSLEYTSPEISEPPSDASIPDSWYLELDAAAKRHDARELAREKAKYPDSDSDRPTGHVSSGTTLSSGSYVDSTYGSDPEGRRQAIPDHMLIGSSRRRPNQPR